MILEIITTKFWGTPDTCEFPIRPDQALLGNQQQQSIAHLYICLVTYPCYVCDVINSYQESVCHYTQCPAGGFSNDISPSTNYLSFSFLSIHLLLHDRKSCLKPSTYSLSATATLLANPASPPIRIADKPKCQNWMPNVFVDDRGFPDKSEYYKNLLHNVKGGPILRKLKHPPPLFDEVDPTFFCVYDEFTPMVSSFEEISSCHILSPMYMMKSTPSSRNIGLSSTTKAFSSPSRTTHVSLIPGMHSLLPSRKSSTG